VPGKAEAKRCAREYYMRNRDKILEANRRYALTHRGEINATKRRLYRARKAEKAALASRIVFAGGYPRV